MARVVDDVGRTVRALTLLLQVVLVCQTLVVRRFRNHMSVSVDYGVPSVLLAVIGIGSAVARDVLRVGRRRPVLTVGVLAVMVLNASLLSIRYRHILLLLVLVVVLMATITYLLPISAVFIAIRIVSRLFHSFMGFWLLRGLCWALSGAVGHRAYRKSIIDS